MRKDSFLESRKRLEHVLSAIAEIEAFTHGVSGKSFLENSMLNNAVLFQFSVIGEAINHVEPAIPDNYEYPWYKVRSFRNLIAHEYFNIKLEAVWLIVTKELPRLKAMVEEVIEKEF